MPIMEGWEVSSDRIEKYQKMLSMDAVGDPIITSKCKLDRDDGFLVVSDNGFSWRYVMTRPRRAWKMASSFGKSKWVRWHDVANIIQKKPGQVLVELKARKEGSLMMDKNGNPKIKKWKFTINKNEDEPRANFKQRKQYFYDIMSEIYNRNKGVTDPPTSDSRM